MSSSRDLTRYSVQRLGLAPGRPVYALVKSVALDRRSLSGPIRACPGLMPPPTRSKRTAGAASLTMPVIGNRSAVALTGLRADPYIRHGLRGSLPR